MNRRDAEPHRLMPASIRHCASPPGLSPSHPDRGPERSTREATIDGERVELDVRRGIPAPGEKLAGPAVFELPESTVLIPPGWTSEIDDTGTIRMSRSR